jgi:hypothetical protein
MRRPRTFGLTVAVCVLTMTPSASAHTDQPAHPRMCPDPQLEWDYETTTFRAWATLNASGCPSREDRQFPLWLSITRSEETSTHGVAREVLCGPFPSSSESDGRGFSCDVALSFDHVEVETATYEVQFAYPGADGQETAYVDVVCISDGAGAGCELEDDRPSLEWGAGHPTDGDVVWDSRPRGRWRAWFLCRRLRPGCVDIKGRCGTPHVPCPRSAWRPSPDLLRSPRAASVGHEPVHPRTL